MSLTPEAAVLRSEYLHRFNASWSAYGEAWGHMDRITGDLGYGFGIGVRGAW